MPTWRDARAVCRRGPAGRPAAHRGRPRFVFVRCCSATRRVRTLRRRPRTRCPTMSRCMSATRTSAPLTGFNIHRGCLALADRPAPLDLRAAPRKGAARGRARGVTNADNVGGVFRNAAAFGAGAVLLSPTCCDPLYRKAMRTSMGATLRVPFARVEPWPDAAAICGTRLDARGADARRRH